MASGYGVYCRSDRIFSYARYIDWSFTTPLQLADLCGLGGADLDVTSFLMGADALMIIAGLVGGLIEDDVHKWFFWLFGMAMFAPIVYYLYRFTGTAPNESKGTYTKIAWLTIVTWSFYPVVWVLAEGLDVIPESLETIMYTILDVSGAWPHSQIYFWYSRCMLRPNQQILAKSLFGFIVISAPRGDAPSLKPDANAM